jgi:predicted DNA-binding transcriptional regulator YafY
MQANKHQLIRYNRLDRCFQNTGKEYCIEGLLSAVNEAILDYDSESTGVQLRTLRKDIAFMRSPAGYDAPIETYKSTSGIIYYRYDNKKFSINNSPLNDTELQQLKNTVSLLQRFEGSPEFEWVNEIAPLLNDKFGLKNQDKKVMSLESNIDYKGYDNITPLFNAIINKTVIKLKYTPFNVPEYEVIFHPYFLKQYNNRWFVFGLNEFNNEPQWNLALDRISDSLENTKNKYIEDITDWEEFFDDMIGVSRRADQQPEEVKLIFNKEQAPYIQTKPLHSSQKSTVREDGSLEVRINVILNYELEMRILSFGEKVRVLAPESLMSIITKRIKLLKEKY